jgi:hypothetical protein
LLRAFALAVWDSRPARWWIPYPACCRWRFRWEIGGIAYWLRNLAELVFDAEDLLQVDHVTIVLSRFV